MGYGPHPDAVCALIAQRAIPTIYGNYDHAIARDLEDCGCAYVTPHDRELGQRSVDWTLAHTGQASKDFMRALPFDLRFAVGETPVHLVHGSPRKVNEYLFEDKPARLYERLAAAEEAGVLVFGHTHKPWIHEFGGVLFVNCGSVGKPKDGDPRAAFAVLEADGDRRRRCTHRARRLRRRRRGAGGRRLWPAGRVRRQARPGRLNAARPDCAAVILCAMATAQATPLTGRTAWARNLAAPVRDFLSTETGSAIVLLTATIAALLWANSPWPDSYESVWTTELSFRLGDWALSADLRDWVNDGLMTFFFLVVGLEAKRELDLGELRDRKRLALPVVAALGGMIVPIAIYLAFNAGGTRRATAGARRCRPTPPSRSGCWRWRRRAAPPVCASSCSRSRWSTTCAPCSSSPPPTASTSR